MNNTKLDGVNQMLVANGILPITLDTANPDSVLAEYILDATSKIVQADAYWFNREKAWRLTPNSDGEYLVPNNCLCIDPVDTNLPYVQRGRRLYDTVNHTYVIDTDDADYIDVDMTLQLEYEELPEQAFRYIVAKAALSFQLSTENEPNRIKVLAAREQETFVTLKREQLNALDLNAMNSPSTAYLISGMPNISGLGTGRYR